MAPFNFVAVLYNLWYNIHIKTQSATFNLLDVWWNMLWCRRFQLGVWSESAAPNNDICLLSFINDLSKECWLNS